MDTVQAIRRSTVNPFITSPAGVPIDIAQPRGFSGNIQNSDRILMGDYGQVGGSDSFAAAYPDSAAAVPAPTFQLRNTPVIPAAVYQQRAQTRPTQVANVMSPAGAAAAAAVPIVSYQQMIASQSQTVQGSRQVNQNSRAAAAAAARAPPSSLQQDMPNPRNMAPSITSVRVSDGGGATRSQVVSSATERVQQLYNLSDNDIQNIMRIIQTESANVFGGRPTAEVPAPEPVVPPQLQPLPVIPESTPQVSFSEPVVRTVSNRDAPAPTVSARGNPQQRLAAMRELSRKVSSDLEDILA
jgi:hypothetical protein